MIITPLEIFDVLVTILLVGFLFMDVFKDPRRYNEDELERYLKNKGILTGFNWKNFWFAAKVTAPAILLHELGHKLVALSYGYNATFHAFYANSTTLFLGILAIAMKIMNFGFVFLVPGFVSITGIGGPEQAGVIAFAGPGVNLILLLISLFIIQTRKMNSKKMHFWVLTKNINLFLFIFNLLPIPGFDGFTVWSSLWQLVF
ncbi:MAG: zinc protease [Candidatus Woesearchaeota archaeon]|nr:MAG: zinc protease [Candidatus Woesearchaeota archaeon]